MSAGAFFDPVEHIAGRADAGVLFLCDHASNALPEPYGDLGLAPDQFQRHIAYDIGAATMTRRLAAAFDAPALLATWSRLLIDPNRGADDPTLVMRISDGAIVPGNAAIVPDEVEARRRAFWQPYRDAVRLQIDAMLAAGIVPAIVSLHSYTPHWKTVARPWHAAVLWDIDPRLAQPFIAALRTDEAIVVGDNEPYDGALEDDTIDAHATQRGLPNLLIEVRQDLIANGADATAWADRLAHHLRPLLADPALHQIQFFGSRVGDPTRARG